MQSDMQGFVVRRPCCSQLLCSMLFSRQVETWRARGRTPLGVDITANLLDTILRDPGYDPTPGRPLLPPLPDALLRTQYSLPLIRMVNGITDSQQKGKVAMSVANLAANAGLPRLLVDIR